jgi:hypothetical protein
MNIEFNYLYRDAGNIKRYGNVVVSNHRGLTSQQIRADIVSGLIDALFFDASLIDLAPLFFESLPFDPFLDHSWHEFDRIDDTPADVNDPSGRDVADLIDQLTNSLRKTRELIC